MSDVKPKLLIIGQGRHGKDTVVDYLVEKYGMNSESSSHASARIFIFYTLKDEFGYKNVDECFNDRHNHRALWYRLICLYNREKKSALAKEIMKHNDIYCGMRDAIELVKCKEENVFDAIIWVDASERVDYIEPDTSINVQKEDADYIVNNNGTLEQTFEQVDKIMETLVK